MIRRILRCGVVSLLLPLFVVTAVRAASSNTSATMRTPAPDFRLVDTEGKEVCLGDLRGKVVVLEFWATWCGPCARSMSVAVDVGQQHRGDVVVLGVNIDDSERKDKVSRYLSARKIPLRSLLAGNAVSRRFGVGAIPHVAVIDREGRIVGKHVGISSEGALREQLLRDIAAAK